MQRQDLAGFSAFYKEKLETELRHQIEKLQAPAVIKESMLYSLEAGGKRIRPLLLFATLDAFGKDPLHGLSAATAIEMIHTYSLIHDDLPSMDNDDLRRGKPTNHKVFGDALAILAGDALLTYSFQIIADTNEEILNAATKIKLISELAKAAGAEGMVGGQVLDIEGEKKSLSIEQLEEIHRHKTGKLLAYSTVAGAIIAGANEAEIAKMNQFANHIGLAFQIRDDILDLEGDEDTIGKKVGSDTVNQKSTYPSLLTMEGAKKALEKEYEDALAILRDLNIKSDHLQALTKLVVTRDH